MLRFFKLCLLVAAIALSAGVNQPAAACPGCKNANETDNLRPRAYMLSILFMLGMPATVFTGFGVAFYRMARRSPADDSALEDYLRQQALLHSQPAPPTPPQTP